MRRFLCYFQLLIVLKTAIIISGLDQADFSAKLGHVVDNVLGAKQFEVISQAVRKHITVWKVLCKFFRLQIQELLMLIRLVQL